jgi:hypothetical protein
VNLLGLVAGAAAALLASYRHREEKFLRKAISIQLVVAAINVALHSNSVTNILDQWRWFLARLTHWQTASVPFTYSLLLWWRRTRTEVIIEFPAFSLSVEAHLKRQAVHGAWEARRYSGP